MADINKTNTVAVAKAQPTGTDLHIDFALSDFSAAYIQDEKEFINDRVFPLLKVEHKSNHIYLFTKDYWFRSEAKLRANGTESAGAGFGLSKITYLCECYSVHEDIYDQDRSNEDAGIDLETTATMFVTRQLMLVKEKAFASAYFKTGVWGNDYVGVATSGAVTTGKFLQWDKTGSDPYEDIRVGRMKIKLATGFDPNKMVISQDVFEKLRMHPAVKDMYKYTSASSITADMLAEYFGVKEIIVAGTVQNTADEGATAVNSFFFSNGILLCYTADKVGLRVATAGVTISWVNKDAGGLQTTVKNFRMEFLALTRIEGSVYFQHKQIAADLGVYYGSVLSA